MNKLSINNGSFNIEEIDLDHGTVNIGRATDNDIKLDDSAVSSHHAKIVTFFNVSYIEDLDSTNGTIVNGRSIKKYTLHTGDIVLLGKHQLLFQGSAAVATSGNGDATVVMSQSDVKNAMASTPEKETPENVTPMPEIAATPPSTPPAPVPATPTANKVPATAAMTENPNTSDILTPERAPAPQPIQRPAPVIAAVTSRAPPPAVTPTPQVKKPDSITERPMRAVMDNITSTPTANKEISTQKPLDSLEQHNEAFSLLNDDVDLDLKIGSEKFTAFGNDESLLIPAFIKSDKTSVGAPPRTPPIAKAAPEPVSPVRKSNPIQAAPVAPHAPIQPPIQAKAPLRKKAARKVLEDPSVSFGNPIDHSAPMGINEVDRVSQYRKKSDATNPGVGMPAVGDRTLLKQIISGDSAFTSSKNKFEIIQIVLGFVIFAIIALIAFASF